MTQASEIIKSIQNGDIKPIYFLAGEETFFIDQISDYIENNLLTESTKSFDQIIAYGLETNLPELILQAKRFPMLGDKQTIIIKEAQHLLKKKSDIEALEKYLEKPSEHTVMVFNYKYKNLDKRKKIYKLINQKGIYFETKRMYEKKILSWIIDTSNAMNHSIDMKSAQMLIDFLGNDLSKIYNEINKLNIILAENQPITPEIIEKHIGISKDYNNFELKSAIAQDNYLKAQKIIQYFSANPKEHPIVVTIAVLYNFFRDLFIYHSLNDKSQYSAAKSLGVNPYFIKEFQIAATKYPMKKVSKIINYLKTADLQSKGINARNIPQKDILNELLYKIMH